MESRMVCNFDCLIHFNGDFCDMIYLRVLPRIRNLSTIKLPEQKTKTIHVTSGCGHLP